MFSSFPGKFVEEVLVPVGFSLEGVEANYSNLCCAVLIYSL